MNQKELEITAWRAKDQNNPDNLPQNQPEGDELVVVASSGDGKDKQIIIARNPNRLEKTGDDQQNVYDGICIRSVPVSGRPNRRQAEGSYADRSGCGCEPVVIFNEEFMINPMTKKLCNHY